MKTSVELLLEIINAIGSHAVIQNSNAFFDELPVFFYSGLIRITKNNELRRKGYQIYSDNIVAGGSSTNDKIIGILKCAAELIERFCLFTFHPDTISIKSRQEMSSHTNTIDPQTIHPQIKGGQFGWIKGKELNTNKDVSLPAQMVYLNYYSWARKNHKEPRFIQQISNGGCFGFTKESAMLRGIYELIERDAILTKYLARLPLYSIDITSIRNKEIQSLHQTIKQYNFENVLVDATSDLGIPTYFSAAIDNSGIVPQVTYGAKASLHSMDAIIGAIEESHMGRTWVRYELLQRDGVIPHISPNAIRTRLERAFYYADKKNSMPLFNSLKHIKFSSGISPLQKNLDSDKNELDLLLDILKKRGIRVIAVDVKPPFLDKYPIFIYKIIMPDLQYLYLEEGTKNINSERIGKVCAFYGKQLPNRFNEIPHFLL